MKKEKSIVIRLFLFFFILYSLFSYWEEGYSNGFLIPSLRFVENNSIELGEDYYFVADVSKFNEKIYSARQPGLYYFSSLPVYIISHYCKLDRSKFLPLYEKRFGEDILRLTLLDTNCYFFYQIILTLLFSIIPASLSVVIFYVFLKKEKIKERLFLSIIYGFLILPYAIFLNDTIFALFLILFSLLLFSYNNQKKTIIGLFLLGFSIFISIYSIPSILIFLFLFFRKSNFFKVFSFFISILPLLIFNTSFFGAFYRLPVFYELYLFSQEFRPIHSKIYINYLANLFSPQVGILFYYPFFFFYPLYFIKSKKSTTSFAIFLFILSSFLIFGRFIPVGTFFGPRYLFISIILSYLFISLNFYVIQKKLRHILIFLFMYSCFVCFSSLTFKREISGFIYPSFDFSLLKNYFFDISQYGPRSRIIENIFEKKPLDLRFLFPEDREFFSNFYSVPNYFNLLLFLLLVFTFWYNYLSQKLKIVLFFSILVFLFYIFYFSKLNSSTIIFSKGFYPSYPIKMHSFGSIIIYSNEDSLSQLSFLAHSFYANRKVEVILNGNKVDEFYLGNNYTLNISLLLELNKGKNEVLFKSTCDRPVELGIEKDYSCYSIFIENYSLQFLEKNASTLIFSKGFYPKYKEDEFRWASDNVEVIYFLPTEEESYYVFYFDILPFLREIDVEFYLNGELKNIFKIAKDGGEVYTLPLKLKKGKNILVFRVNKGCLVVDEILHNFDKRCISMSIRNIRIQKIG